MTLRLTGDTEADTLLNDDPFALLLGMLLDQQIPMEVAFAGPSKILQRLGTLDPSAIAQYDPEEFLEMFRTTPAVHRFPSSMATRVQSLARMIVSDWGGDASAIWTSGSPDGAEILRRLMALPGFGEQKAKIFIALLGKRFGLAAPGWEMACGKYGEHGSHRSVADIVDDESFALVRESKRAEKAAAKG
jgi:uncharacterized HhH-GPD family protein